MTVDRLTKTLAIASAWLGLVFFATIFMLIAYWCLVAIAVTPWPGKILGVSMVALLLASATGIAAFLINLWRDSP